MVPIFPVVRLIWKNIWMLRTRRPFYEVSLLVRVFVKLISTLSETSKFSFMDQRQPSEGWGLLCELSIYYIPGTGLDTLVLILTLSPNAFTRSHDVCTEIPELQSQYPPGLC